MRCYYKGVCKDGAGKIIPSATVAVYLYGTTTPASVYTTLAGATAVNSVTSGSNGSFEFWVDRFDYDQDQCFDLTLSKTGYTSQTWSNVNIDNVVLGTYTISADKTVTTHLVVPKGVVYSVASGKTLTISGLLEAGLYQIFDGDGSVSLGGNNKTAYPEWWGGTSTDVGAAVNSAFAALGTIGAVELTASTYPLTTTIKFPLTSIRLKLYSHSGSAITVAGTDDRLDLTATNENYGWHVVEGLTLTGPDNYYTGTSTSTGCGIRIQRAYDDTTNVATSYNTVIRDCTIEKFKYGIRMQCAIGTNIEGKSYIRFNQYGVYIDGGCTNANTFSGTLIRNNAIAGLYSSGTTGGSLTYPTANFFNGCLFESNVLYDATPTVGEYNGMGIYLAKSYGFVFNGCYSENHQYSIILDSSSSFNKFIGCRTAPGSSGLDAIKLSGATVYSNSFIDCSSANTAATDVNVESDNASQKYNEFINCQGYNFIAGSLSTVPYILNCKPISSDAYSGIGKIAMPPHGYYSNPGEGTTAGRIEGLATATATLYWGGFGEVMLGSLVAAAADNTTITTFDGMTKHSIAVLWNYQDTRTVTIKHAGATGNIVLKPTLTAAITVDAGTHAGTLATTADAVFTAYGQMIVFYVNGLGRAYEIGRNF